MTARTALLSILAAVNAALIFAQNPATTVNVDAAANHRPIDPNIYGIAYGDAHDMQALNAPLNRWGGNATTRYNWQIDAHSAAADWYFETYSDGNGTPSGSADQFLATTRSSNASAQPMFTIPMIDYLANLGLNRSTLAGFSVKKYGAQTATDPWNSDAGNGVSAATGRNITGNDPLDTGVANSAGIQQSWVQHFVNAFGPSTSATGVRYYILDNEPSLWYSTHRDVHPSPANYQEMYNKIVAYATAIRAADPNAKIVGFEEWSWWAQYFSGFDQANGASAANSDYNTHNHTYYYPWLLQQLYAYKQQTGTQLLDVLTVHCYNALPGGNDDSLSGQQARNRETRILWDPSFSDPSWYGDIGISGRVINWIPTLRAMVNQYHPGLQIGCTEYNWGAEANLNGATTQADVLGIYGREGFDLATRWTVAKNTNTTPTTYYVTYLASQIYRNYDGNNGTFGDTSVAASVANPDNLSAFAATRASDGALTVMVINKQPGSTPVTVNLSNFSTSGTAQVWQINSASQSAIAHLPDVAVSNNAISMTAPSQSITLLVIPGGSVVVTPPPAPTGLAAAPGNGTVALSWNSASGATSYSVKRAGVSGGPYTTVGTISGLTYTDSGLTNGTTYYYVVSASNSAGSSANSTEIAATPSAPVLTWSSSAAAMPSTVVAGSGVSITATVTDTGTASLSNANIEVQVFNSSGTAVSTNVWSGQNFIGGQSHQYTYTWNVPSTQATGNYTVMIGVFDAGWTTNYYWNSNGATITVTSGSVPPAPTGLTAAPGNAQVALAWTASSGATSYNVYRGTTPGGEGSTPIATGITATTYTNTGLTNGTTYYYKVAAVNSAGTSAMSNEASAKPASVAVDVTASVKISATTFTYSKPAKAYVSTVTVQNVTQQTIAGPLQLVLKNLTAGATLSNASGTTGGNPYITITSNSLAAGKSVSVKLQVHASSAQINYTPAVYSGTF
ncbi:MAG TPA: glycoside hydrolase family 44 protein [Candidatus Solibacter sp.]|nr:glycoside hydrolase family 44 protein [Candidatus Solibacter sp.]